MSSMGHCMEATKNALKNDFAEKTGEEVDAASDHILDHTPRAKNGLKQPRWQTKELKNKDGHAFGWLVSLVEKAIRQFAAEGDLAQKEITYCLTLFHLFPWIYSRTRVDSFHSAKLNVASRLSRGTF